MIWKRVRRYFLASPAIERITKVLISGKKSTYEDMRHDDLPTIRSWRSEADSGVQEGLPIDNIGLQKRRSDGQLVTSERMLSNGDRKLSIGDETFSQTLPIEDGKLSNGEQSTYRQRGQVGFKEKSEKLGRWWHREVEIPSSWDAPHFQNRLIHAYRTLAFTPSPKGSKPKASGNAWPQFSYDFEDLVAQAGSEDDRLKKEHNRRNYVRQYPTREQLTQMDLLFNTVYEFNVSHQLASKMLISWAYARYRNIALEIICDKFSVSKPTIYKKIEEVATLCSASLNRRTIRPF